MALDTNVRKAQEQHPPAMYAPWLTATHWPEQQLHSAGRGDPRGHRWDSASSSWRTEPYCREWSPPTVLLGRGSEGLLGWDSRFFACVGKSLCWGQGSAGHSWARQQLSTSEGRSGNSRGCLSRSRYCKQVRMLRAIQQENLQVAIRTTTICNISLVNGEKKSCKLKGTIG